jgi:hypothetical protein
LKDKPTRLPQAIHAWTAHKKYTDVLNAGEGKAHIIRDRISTRRARGAMRRNWR